MIGVVRHFFVLVLVAALSLSVIAVLLFSQHSASNAFDRNSQSFIVPVARQVDKARIALEKMESERLIELRDAETDRPVPYRFIVQAAVDGVDAHLAEIIRLNNQNAFTGAFDLPARARAQLMRVKSRLLEPDLEEVDAPTTSGELIDPLRGTLVQLGRVYELEQRKQRERFQDALARRTRVVAVTAALLLLVALPLVTLLALRLRQALRQEARNRRDLAEANENLSVLALQDELTGLGNRHEFRSRLEQTVGTVKRKDRSAALMYIDLDNFKRINDSMGHDIGDQVLKAIGARLFASVRATDTVVRLGGDEFTIIVSETGSADDAGSVAEKLLQGIAAPLQVADRTIVVHASIGITMMPADSAEPGVLMKNADMAMYRAKEAGGHRFKFFVEAMNRTVTEHMRIEEELRGAIQADAFDLHYQPQVSLPDGGITGAEALLRWRRADGTRLSPDVFIPVAEHTGLMPEIGEWVLARACRDIADLNNRQDSELSISINLSARQFRDPRLVQRMEHALACSGLAPRLLEVELTETTLIDDVDKAIETLTTLRELGVRVAIDDFGIGYSSLGYLRRLPIDTLKIDRSFVSDIETDTADRSIVDTIVAMAHTLGLRVVAEGVETAWQLDHLSRRGCDAAQGFLLSRPLPLSEFSVLAGRSSARRTAMR